MNKSGAEMSHEWNEYSPKTTVGFTLTYAYLNELLGSLRPKELRIEYAMRESVCSVCCLCFCVSCEC